MDEKYGLKTQDLEQIINVLKLYSEIEKGILYGSRAKGNYKPGSDVDLCLVGKDITYQLLTQLAVALDDLLLPYSIDLSALSLIENEDLLSHIERKGIVIYERTTEIF